ncbi:glutamate-rich protein 3 isoform X1 [Camelus dromedarius]|uniref:glutamate-rich protein 3 isoform X1 n=1 Tax=Camelus dromedarius TaxID=9838 RepID=UPI00311A2F0A
MSCSHPAGLLAAYNSLTDKHLAGYFNNTRIRRHLLRSGLITRSGRILSEKEYKLNIMRRDHQKYIRECLAQAIFHKVLDLERYHQLEIKKKLETLARKERMQRFKGEHMRWTIENNRPVLSPRPPVGPKTNQGHSVLVDGGHCGPVTPTTPRPYTAPGNMQPPIRLQPLPSNIAVGTVPKITSGSRSKTSLLENEAPFPIGGKKAVMKFRSAVDNSQGMHRYQPPNINSYMMPIPPPPPAPSGRLARENRPETWRRRRFRPTTAPNGLEPLFTRDSRRIHKTPLHSNAAITMIYLGKNVHLAYDHSDFRDEIKVYQQHCGGENLCVYKGKLLEKETFQFISKRHHGFPFSLTFFLNGIQVNRLSSCCEYKHRKGSRLGGKRGYFGFVCVERSSPCYKCIIAMGLDKKTTSPKPRKEKSIERREEPKKGEGKLRKEREYLIPRRKETEGSKASASVIFSAQELNMGVDEVRTAVEEMERKGEQGQDAWEEDRENILKYEYEEDFEVEEKRDETANEGGQADGRTSGMSEPPSDDETGLLDPEKESETSSPKAPDADDNVKDEDIKTTSSPSSRSHTYSSCSEDESSVGDREDHARNSPNESARSLSSQELSENDELEKFHLPTEDSLETETEEQEIIKAEVETKPLPIQENLKSGLEEETEKGTQVIAEGLSEKSRDRVSKEEKEKERSKLWEGSTAKVKGKEAGPRRVDKGVGRVTTAEAVEPDHPCRYDSESGVSSADEGETRSGKLEAGTGAAPNRNLVVEERAAFSSNKESKQVVSQACTLEKKEAVEEDEVPQPRDADPEEIGDMVQWEKAGASESPLGQWKPTAELPGLVEQFIEEREIPEGRAGGAEAEAEGHGRLDKEGLSPRGREAARGSGGLEQGAAPEEQAWRQTALETEKAASEGEQVWGKAVLTSEAAAMTLEPVQEAAAPREAARPEKEESERGEAVSEAGSEKPGVEDSEEEVSTDLEDVGPVEDAASEREDGLEEAVLRGEAPARERKAVRGTGAPGSSWTCGKAQATRMGVSEHSLEELRKDDVGREEARPAAESSKEDDGEDLLPEELDVAGERRKAERPKTPRGRVEPEREEVTWARELQDGGTLEGEQKLKGKEGGPAKEAGPEEATQPPRDGVGCHPADEAAPGAPERTEDTRPQGEEPLGGREATMFEAAPGCENVMVLRKEGEGDRLGGAPGAERRGRAEPLSGENEAPAQRDGGPGPEAGGALGAPGSPPAGEARAPPAALTAADQARGCAAEGADGLAGREGTDEEGPSQGPGGVAVTARTQDVLQGDTTMADTLSEEVTDAHLGEEADKECPLGTGVMKDGDAERAGSLRAAVVAEEGLGAGGVAETVAEREALADSTTAEGKTEASTASFSDVAGEETWHKVGELLGKTAAAGKAAAEEAALGREQAPAVEEVTGTWAPEAEVEAPGEPSDLEEKTPQPWPDQEGGEAESTQGAESLGEEAGKGSRAGGQERGAAEEFRLGLSQDSRAEPGRESRQDMETHPAKPDCPGTQEKQRESENPDVSLNDNRKA